MKSISLVFILFQIFLNLSCAFNESEGDLNRRQNKVMKEKYQALRENYNIVTGLYQGTLKLQNGDVREISIGIYILEILEGSNSAGEKIFKPVLKSVFKQLQPIALPVLMDAQYFPESGELTFGKAGDSKEIDDLHTISATFDRQINGIKGIANKSSGYLGEVELKFVTKDVNTDPEGEDNEFYRNLRVQYEKIKGTYVGTIVKDSESEELKKVWKIELGLYIVEIKYGNDTNGEPKFRPVLIGRFKQLSPVAPNVLMEVQHIAETGKLVLLAQANGTSGGTDLIKTIMADLKNDKITGVASKFSGFWGNLELALKSRNVDIPRDGDQEDYNKRLMEEYKKIEGEYEGTISPVGLESFDFLLRIFTIQVTGENGLTPKLKAYYRRKNDKYNVTELTMDVQFKTEMDPPGIDMAGQKSNASNAYFVVLNGRIQGGKIKGVYHEQRGQQGPFQLKKVR